VTPDDSRRAWDLFEQVLELDEDQRAVVLDGACAGDPLLREEVIRLLEADHEAASDSFLVGRAIEDAAQLIPDRGEWRAALLPGMVLGVYEITGSLGAGGMGEVYRARDLQLDREVAIKVLSAALAGDSHYMNRFRHEAQILASLNHPNIATVYGLEQSALVMELVEGSGLHGPLPLEAAIPIARQIAIGLEAAHEHGIVHRDLKPANIRITPTGTVKLLDFGLAKSSGTPERRADSSSDPTHISPAMTQAGMVLGTAAYMAPEQALGQATDKRADIWAFGVVFYELLSGRQLFSRKTTAETLAAVVDGNPDLGNLPANTPSHIRYLLGRCLCKDPNTRLRDIGEARVILDQGVEPAVAPPRRRSIGWLVAAALLFGAIGVAIFSQRHPVEEAPRFRLAVAPPGDTGFSLTSLPAVSPNGRYLAFSARANNRPQLWVRDLDAPQARPLAGTEGAYDPFWSPDNRFIAFFVPGRLKKIDTGGGPALTICDVPYGRGGSWNQGDVIVFAPSFGDSLFRVPAAGGTPEPVTKLDPSAGETSHRFPWFLPDGRHFLFTARNGSPERTAIYLGDLETRTRHVLFTASSNAVYAQPGYLLFVRERALMAQKFDAIGLKTAGGAFPVAEQVDYLPGSVQGQFSVSQTGVLAYYSGGSALESQLTWFDRTGKPLETLGPPAVMQAAALSPDEKTSAVDRLDPTLGTYDLWLYDLVHHRDSRFTFDSGNDTFPVWLRDGSQVLFSSDRNGRFGLYRKSAIGGRKEELLYEMEGVTVPTDASMKGLVLFTNTVALSGNDIWSLSLEAGSKAAPVLKGRFSESHGRLSRDGRWLAYESSESGSPNVFVESFPGGDGQWQISTAGGTRPVWSRSGKELFYVAPDGKIVASEVKSGEGFPHGPPTPLFGVRMSPTAPFDVSGDGKRFLILNGVEPDVTTPITLVVNWYTSRSKP